MTKYMIMAAFAIILMLGGCQFNGTYDFSNLLNEGERIVITKDAIDADGDTPGPKIDRDDYRVLHPDDAGDKYYRVRSVLGIEDEKWFGGAYDYFRHRAPTAYYDAKFGSQPNRLEVSGNAGLFLEYNSNMEDSFYIVSGGKPSEHLLIHLFDHSGEKRRQLADQYQVNIPSGTFGYNGKVALADYTDFSSDFITGTVEAEANFENMSLWIEFAGTGITKIDNRFVELGIDHDGEFSGGRSDYTVELVGWIFGENAEAMEGAIYTRENPDGNQKGDFTTSGLFVAERNNTPTTD